MSNSKQYEQSYFINVNFTLIDRPTLIDKILNYNAIRGFEYVVTANADHLVRLAKDDVFKKAYNTADVTTCDSRVVKFLAKILGYNVGEVITGSDLTRDVITKLSGLSVPLVVIGSDNEEFTLLKEKYHLNNVYHYNPPMGFIHSDAEVNQCVDFINDVGEGIILLCVGSPQQELLAQKIKLSANFKGIALCVGASIHFLTGKVKRAPKWVQIIAMEWAYRLIKEPKRLLKRYIACLDIFRLALLFALK